MRLNINLASQRYGDARRFAMQWTVLIALLTAITCVLAYAASVSITNWRSGARAENEVRNQIAERDRQRAQVQALLNSPQNRMTHDRSQLLNELITRKAVSWTLVLSDLEKLMPQGLHVTSITPRVTPEQRIELQMVVAGSSRGPALDLVRQLEKSPHFAAPELRAEAMTTNTAIGGSQTPNVQFTIVAFYVPESGQEKR